jgi:two-component system OmpR family response regulator
MHVDDDDAIRAITLVALERVGGFVLQSCNGGAQALQQVGAFAPQMILLDVMMPEMDGPTTLERLKQETDLGRVLVVFMTAKVQEQEIARYRALGACDVIIKPFDPMTLSERLHRIWIQHNV